MATPEGPDCQRPSLQVSTLQSELQRAAHVPGQIEPEGPGVNPLKEEVRALEAQRDHFRALIEESATALEEQVCEWGTLRAVSFHIFV